MQLIPPHKKLSKRVTHCDEIKQDFPAMLGLLNADNFTGKWKKGLALHHSQVSIEPYHMFVVHKNLVEAFDGWEVVCNAKILERYDAVPFKEACLSYPHRAVKKMRRYARVLFEADVLDAGMFQWKLKHITLEVTGLAAFVVQHEQDHAQGRFIF